MTVVFYHIDNFRRFFTSFIKDMTNEYILIGSNNTKKLNITLIVIPPKPLSPGHVGTIHYRIPVDTRHFGISCDDDLS